MWLKLHTQPDDRHIYHISKYCIFILPHSLTLLLLKVPGSIASDFFQTFGDFGVRKELIFFSLPLVNFTADQCTIWTILMKM